MVLAKHSMMNKWLYTVVNWGLSLFMSKVGLLRGSGQVLHFSHIPNIYYHYFTLNRAEKVDKAFT